MDKKNWVLGVIAIALAIFLSFAHKEGMLPMNKEPPAKCISQKTHDDLSTELLRCYLKSDMITKYYMGCIEAWSACKAERESQP